MRGRGRVPSMNDERIATPWVASSPSVSSRSCLSHCDSRWAVHGQAWYSRVYDDTSMHDEQRSWLSGRYDSKRRSESRKTRRHETFEA